MTSNDTSSITQEAKQGPNAQKLDEIANYMEDMLKDMKHNIEISHWKELCNNTFTLLDVTKAAVKKNTFNNHRQVLETIHEDKIFNPIPPAEAKVKVQTPDEGISDIGFITEISLPHISEQNKQNKSNVKDSTKTNVSKPQKNNQQITNMSQKLPDTSVISNKLIKNKSTSAKDVVSTTGKHNPEIITTVVSKQTKSPTNTQKKCSGNGKPNNQNKSKSVSSNNKQKINKALVLSPVQMGLNKIDELNCIKKNKTSSSLRPALSKMRVTPDTKNREKQNRTVNPTNQICKVELSNTKKTPSDKIQNNKRTKDEKNNTVKQIQNRKPQESQTVKVENTNMKPDGDKATLTEVKTMIKVTNNPVKAPASKPPVIANKIKENFQMKPSVNAPGRSFKTPIQPVKNDKTPKSTNNLNASRNTNSPTIQTILVSNAKQNDSPDSKYKIKPTDLTTSSLQNGTCSRSIDDVISEYVNIVNCAKKERKTFTITGYYFALRRAFAERGWIEKVREIFSGDKETWRKLESLSNIELAEGIRTNAGGEKYRKAFLSKLLAGHQVDFYWDYVTNPFNVNNDKVKRTVINRFPLGTTKCYTSKAGLSDTLKESHWYYIEGYANVASPRTYVLNNKEEKEEFIDDFRLTAAISLLRWINVNADNTNKIMSNTGTITMSVYNFAVLQIGNFIRIKEHRDIENDVVLPQNTEWDQFLDKYYKIVRNEDHFVDSGKLKAPYMIKQSKCILNQMNKFLPHSNVDGMMNLWMLKPHNGSCGNGILVCRTLKNILETAQAKPNQIYVIQKYIERPLLIYETKFDIRQWFLVTCMPFLKIWMYKECYIRFSSQIFNLNKLDESIHLTNNSVQCRYKNGQRNPNLPKQNMWHSDTFQKYLADLGYPFAWKNFIYQGMKEALVGLFMACQDKMSTRINSFELCGADFMVSDDFKPYLIEINSRPAIFASTNITAVMCPKVLEDVIRVTIDHARNPKASTGNFELIYTDRLNYVIPKPSKELETISVAGISCSKLSTNKNSSMFNNINCEIDERANAKTELIEQFLNIEPDQVKKDVRGTLEKILSIIHSNLEKPTEENGTTVEFHSMLSEFVDIISSKEIQEKVPEDCDT